MRLSSASAEKTVAAGSGGDVKTRDLAAEDSRAAARAQEERASHKTFAVAVAAQRAPAEKMRVVINMSVKAHRETKLRRFTNALDLSSALTEVFNPKGSARAIALLPHFNTSVIKHGYSLVRCSIPGWKFVRQLCEMGIEIDDRHLLSALLTGSPFVCSWRRQLCRTASM